MFERMYRFNSKRIRKKEKYANQKWILSNLFCWPSNLLSNDDNDDVIYYRPGSEIGPGFGEPCGTPSRRISRSTSLS